MSLCRFSSMNWKCDLYVYGGEYGWAVHVASNRFVGEAPQVPSILYGDAWTSLSDQEKGAWALRWHEATQQQHAWLDTAEREPIGLPYDGHSWYDLGDTETIELLENLREAGYVFPEGLEDEIREDPEYPDE